ncbi:ATP-dependent DNA helicase [Ferdinandcohnia quinoae]|uniref:ATP-dependent DNA helicase n=1 Tax=Fredinandcohnia quinoae TaxID=2918902 RepID=A0AAW5E4C4_9BACI|nr:ATP-dependent DNA helicase [Fredinandcohnia sp. SECRCQ15]MCH1627338.1 ATP-dependent DNA helicase [Fredinandcohnia sp. SECRCQ15]
MIREKLPFNVTKNDNFFNKLNDWIGDVFYDILPEKGFELRDEQIFMAFQLERAFKEKSIVFAEAGVGTGKTIVYLIYAICYARYIGKPAIISCADESLIEQLVKPEGDIAKIAEALDLNIDVRLAKAQDQYLCLRKLDDVNRSSQTENIAEIYESLPSFVTNHSTLQTFHHYGDRKTYPNLTDEEWKLISWDSFQDCFSCDMRHRCGQTLSRDFYRKAVDLIICSHDFYMEHVWTMEARKREGQLPFLPESSCVVFDEGHLLEFSAQKALTYRTKESTLESLLTRLLENDIREEFALLIESTIEQNELFFSQLKKHCQKVEGSDRFDINFTSGLLNEANRLYNMLDKIGEALVFESETYTIDHYELNIVDEYLDQMEFSLKLLIERNDSIAWVEIVDDSSTLVIMPHAVEDILGTKVFSKKIPFIFSSATLSENKSFDYIASSLGITNFQSFSVESPFDYDEQMHIQLPIFSVNQSFDKKVKYVFEEIKKTDGRALLLFNTKEELIKFKKECECQSDFEFLFEGDQEISQLVSRFQNNENSILCAVSLWEGLDIPGPSLSNVIIWSLPFPPNDPVFQAKRKDVENSFWMVDVPYMLLRLRQGIGRLIRTNNDRGRISILLEENLENSCFDKIKNILPSKKLSN